VIHSIDLPWTIYVFNVGIAGIISAYAEVFRGSCFVQFLQGCGYSMAVGFMLDYWIF
jgi:hypothetical protein